jgi:hypothetical protein
MESSYSLNPDAEGDEGPTMEKKQSCISNNLLFVHCDNDDLRQPKVDPHLQVVERDLSSIQDHKPDAFYPRARRALS